METLSDVSSAAELEEEESLDGFFTAKEVVGKKVDSIAISKNNAMFSVAEQTKVKKKLYESVNQPENCTNLVVLKKEMNRFLEEHDIPTKREG